MIKRNVLVSFDAYSEPNNPGIPDEFRNAFGSWGQRKTKDNINLMNSTFLKLKVNNLQNKKLNWFLKQFYICAFNKIKFSGKGYKIKKNSKQSLILLFNRSHITIIWWKNIILKKLKKYKIYIKYNYKNLPMVQTILNTRPVNIFTKKGLRNSRQILKKKKGKK